MNIGSGSDGYFTGRIDEVRVSNIQRTFSWTTAVPTSTPPPTQTPVRITGTYAVDANTAALFHLDYEIHSPYPMVYEEATQQYDTLSGQAVIVPNGRYNAGLYLDGNGSSLYMGNLGYFDGGAAEAWVYFCESFGIQPIIVATPHNNVGPTALFLGVPAQGSVSFGIYDGTNYQWVASGVTPADLSSNWHHIAGTWGSRGFEVWIDGVLRNASSGYIGMGTGQPYDFLAECDFVGNCMNSILDEVRVSNTQRTFAPASSAGPIRSVPSRPTLTPRAGIRAPAQASNSGFLLFLPFLQLAPTETFAP